MTRDSDNLNPNRWTKQRELRYWTAESADYYLDNIKQKYSLFNVNEFITLRFGQHQDALIDTAIDIGGGAYGGALCITERLVKQAILVDALTPEFRAMGNIPLYIDSITADFNNIPLKREIADIVFAWNVFDHATNNAHFIIGMDEVKRLLKPGGLFFGSFPLRKQPSSGHPVTLTEQLVMRQLKKFDILWTFKVHEPVYRDKTLFVVAEKMLRLS